MYAHPILYDLMQVHIYIEHIMDDFNIDDIINPPPQPQPHPPPPPPLPPPNMPHPTPIASKEAHLRA